MARAANLIPSFGGSSMSHVDLHSRVAFLLVVSAVFCSVASAVVPDGNGLLAYRIDSAGQVAIYTMQPDGSALPQLTFDDWSDQADWSPDGAKIVFTSNRTGHYQIWVMNGDGSG